MKQELAPKARREQAQSSTCATKALLNQFDEMEPLLCTNSTNPGLSN